MTSEQFAYWMQGFVELNGAEPTAEQWQSIKDHLKTVFVKVTPPAFAPHGPLDLRGPKFDWPQINHEIQITCDASGRHSGSFAPFNRIAGIQ